MAKIQVQCVPVGAFEVNCYIVENTDTRECLIVDAGADAAHIITAVEERRPVALLLTHAHFDHIGAVDAICTQYGIPLYVHELDAPKLADPYENVAAQFGCDTVVQTTPTLVRGGDVLTLAGMSIRVLHTPGHTSGSVCYVLPELAGVLTGDTLFAHGYGRTDFPDGSFAQMRMSLRTLFHLSPKQKAYPGHGESGWAGRDRTEDA